METISESRRRQKNQRTTRGREETPANVGFLKPTPAPLAKPDDSSGGMYGRVKKSAEKKYNEV